MKYSGFGQFLHGCDYNPEQWRMYPHVIEEDIAYMKKAHCNVVSLGIFAWALLEPAEGKYDFTFFDYVVERLTENGIKIILATPSAARPRWLAEKYPEVRRVAKSRHRELYNARHNYCYTSPVYREKVAQIDRLIAERYKDNKNIIMWHISNEIGGECHCELCQQAFREWLKEKYHHDLNELNHAWWASFWSHDVTDWDQIHSPTEDGEGDRVMTGLYADWREFVSYQSTDFMRHEIEVVSRITPEIPVTTNFMGPYNYFIDYHYMKNFVDVISWDIYPEWHSARGNVLESYSAAFAHDLHRGFKQQPFLLMESTPSLTNWLPINKLKRPGMHKLSSLMAVAHGSDSVQYFQWRKGRGGSEKFHGAVIDHNGKAEGRVFEDVKQVGETLEKLQEIVGSKTVSKVALVYEYKNRWLLDNASGFQLEDKKYKRTCINHYKEFWKRGINVDVIGLNVDLSGYEVLILPMLYSMSEQEIDKVERFVASGGTVIATYVTGYADEHDLCYLGGFPGGKLKDVFGLTADEIDSLYETDSNRVELWGKTYKAVDYCELITSHEAQVLGQYTEDFYRGYPAVLKNEYQKGTAYYIGFRDTGEFLADFYANIITEHDLGGYDLPEGVTVHTRQNENWLYTFVENYSDEEQTVELAGEYEDMETGEVVCCPVKVEGFGIRILKRPI
ncbi:MAG: beta-galactosidase [Lachnospiraceae bacterium]|nr:beta-galactosidase [Lachnospiraceae bacterium]